jgi:2-oxoglutarate ferredoxin oxidoreductase subunit alpha
MEEEEQRYETVQVEDAELVLVAYGISSRVCRETVEIARKEGLKLGMIRPITLWPFPVKAFEQAKEAKAYLTVEMNILGQMTDDVRLATGGRVPVDHYGSIFEIPESEGIIAKAKEMLKKEGE